MSVDWDFGQLDLADSEVDSGERRLKPGRYICVIKDANLEKTSTDKNGRRIQLILVDKNGAGSITESINIHLPKSPDATEIGKKHLKTLLTHGGHESPSAPGDINSLKGLVVGVNVVAEPFEDQKGEKRMGSAVDGWHPYFNPEGATGLGELAPKQPTEDGLHPNQKGGVIDDKDFDDIPF